MSISLQERAVLSGLVDPILGSVTGPLDRVQTTIRELGYATVIEDLLSPELIGREQSLLASDDVMVASGRPANKTRPIFLAVTEDGAATQTGSCRVRRIRASHRFFRSRFVERLGMTRRTHEDRRLYKMMG